MGLDRWAVTFTPGWASSNFASISSTRAVLLPVQQCIRVSSVAPAADDNAASRSNAARTVNLLRRLAHACDKIIV